MQWLKEADSVGTVVWSWTPATRTPGAATATVSCALGTRQGTGMATFAVQELRRVGQPVAAILALPRCCYAGD